MDRSGVIHKIRALVWKHQEKLSTWRPEIILNAPFRLFRSARKRILQVTQTQYIGGPILELPFYGCTVCFQLYWNSFDRKRRPALHLSGQSASWNHRHMRNVAIYVLRLRKTAGLCDTSAICRSNIRGSVRKLLSFLIDLRWQHLV